MVGLVLKDMYGVRQNILIFVVVCALAGIVFQPADPSFYLLVCILYCAMQPLTNQAYDEQAKWEKYALSMPVSRKQVVLSRYVSMILFMVAGLIFASLFIIVTSQSAERMQGFSNTVLQTVCLAVIGGSVMIPCGFLFGVEKARIVVMVLCFVPTLIIMSVNSPEMRSRMMAMLSNTLLLNVILSLTAVTLLILSVAVSMWSYEKKEF